MGQTLMALYMRREDGRETLICANLGRGEGDARKQWRMFGADLKQLEDGKTC